MRRINRSVPVLFCLIFFLAAVSDVSSQQNPVKGGVQQKVDDRFVPEPSGVEVETWVENLEIPWSLVFLPNGDALVSERPGKIKIIKKGRTEAENYMAVPETSHTGEGGLMGLALHPRFSENSYVYAMHTYKEGRELFNRVVRLIHRGNGAEFDRTIIDKIPGHTVHNGGRILFGPDLMLYVCTGDIWQAELAQDKNSLNDKILRLTPDGDIPSDNPFSESPVWSYGHRNPQGLAWHPETGDLFSSEHGPSGEYGLWGKDEINVIQKGGNFGWPEVVGAPGKDAFIDPLVMWQKATPPGGIAFAGSSLFVATLRSKSLVKIELETADKGYSVSNIERWFASGHFSGNYGRLRDAVSGPDNKLYVLTSNRDGRGNPFPGDDKILRISFH